MVVQKVVIATALILSIVLSGVSFPRHESQPIQTNRINVDVDLVLVNLSVTDSRNRYVQDLQKENFQIWEDKIEQKIQYFSREDAPISLGIVLDKSGSMGGGRKLPQSLPDPLEMARTSAYSCLKDGLRDDEYFLIEFSENPQVVADFTTDITALKDRLQSLIGGGRTALWDSIYLAVRKLEKATNSRKALLVLTDGFENHSRYSLSQLKDFLREQDVRIYFIEYGVDQLAELTGGRVFVGSNPCGQLKADIKNQYVIGYRPTNRARDGTWRQIRVKLDPKTLPREIADSNVRTRSGYYAESGPETEHK